jgi:hypothetical protein
MKVNKLKSLVAGSFLLFGAVSNANAALFTWSFDNGASGGIFAYLDFDDTSKDFTIRDVTTNSFLLSPNGINGISFDFISNVSLTTPSGLQINTTQPPLLSGFDQGFSTANNQATSELNDNETSLVYNFGNNIVASNINGIAIRLNTNNGNNLNDGAWIAGTEVTTAVPEPETYAMFLAGLGLLGFVARRKQA